VRRYPASSRGRRGPLLLAAGGADESGLLQLSAQLSPNYSATGEKTTGEKVKGIPILLGSHSAGPKAVTGRRTAGGRVEHFANEVTYSLRFLSWQEWRSPRGASDTEKLLATRGWFPGVSARHKRGERPALTVEQKGALKKHLNEVR
jgi:hypothetical protein